MAPAAPLGNLVRLLPLQLSELPAHPALTKIDRTPKVVNPAAQGHTNNADTDGGAISQKRATRDLPQQPLSDDSGFPSQAQVRDEATLSKFDEGGRPRLRPFVKEVLDQATIFVDDTLPVTFSQDKEKSSDPAVAKVRLVKRDIDISQLSRIPWTTSSIPRKTSSPTGLQSEAWFGRRSRHVNQRQEGTADFMEFEQGLMADHSKHEKDYTPDVFDAHQVMNWDAETVSSAFTFGGSYAQIRMCSTFCLIMKAICAAG